VSWKRPTLSFILLTLVFLAGTRDFAQAPADAPSLQTITQEQTAFDDPASPRLAAQFTMLQLNDVYSTVPVNGQGGLARVATLKRRLAAAGRTPFLVISGDFLSSSVASTIFKGEQMIAALNAAGVDLGSLGNHEFDFGLEVLLQRMTEAKWEWVVSNVLDRQTGKPVGNASPFAVRTFGSLKVGFIGLCLTTEMVRRESVARVQLVDPLEAAGRYIPMLEAQQVDTIVALTHLTYEEDRALAERFPEIDVIVGGHEHYPITAMAGRTLISKSGSDARLVARIDVGKTPSGRIESFFDLLPITAALPDDPGTATVVASYESRLGAEMEKVVAQAAVPLNAVSFQLRSGETNLGNLVVDALRADAEADIAIVNSGGIRGNRIYGAGPVTRRMLIEMHPFGNIICKVEVTGRVIAAALEHGVSRLPVAAGQFPQVSGMTFTIDPSAPPGARVRDIRVQGRSLENDRTYTLALPDFMLLGGDGYSMFASQRVLISPEAGNMIVAALEAQFSGRELSPSVEGRIVVER
jgi:5'-nucleotidase